MIHPLESISSRVRRALFGVFGTSLLINGITVYLLGLTLGTAAAPLGIISLELAGDGFIIGSILKSWGSQGQILAGFILGLNCLFVISYCTFIAVGCLWAAERLRMKGRHAGNAGKMLAWGQWGAAAVGLCGDSLLVAILYDPHSYMYGLGFAARICTEIKFTLVLAGTFYIFLGVYFALMERYLRPKTLNRAVRPYKVIGGV